MLALAVDEGPRHAPEQTALEAKRQGNGFVLNGAQAVRRPGRVGRHDRHRRAHRRHRRASATGITLFAVPKDAAGLEVENVALVDSSKAARLTFDNVELDADAVIGEVDGGWAPLVARARRRPRRAPRPSWSASPRARRR